jgi:hypothetical protein
LVQVRGLPELVLEHGLSEACPEMEWQEDGRRHARSLNAIRQGKWLMYADRIQPAKQRARSPRSR